MPDPEKEAKKKLDGAEDSADAAKDAESGPPPLKTEVEESAEAAAEKVSGEDKDTKDTPPDLVPDPDDEAAKEDSEGDATPFDDDKTDQAIDEIIAKEGDDLLAVQDAVAAKGGIKPPRKHGRLGGFFRNKWVRYILLLLVLGGIAALTIIPKTRYWVLNSVGVRSSSSVVVVDSTTQLPLKGVHVEIGAHQADTDSDGEAKFKDLRLGPAQLVITQTGFEEVKRNIIIGWGSNPQGNIALKATGVQFVIEVRDYLSEEPVEGVEATDGEVTAISGKDGKITLTLRSAVVAKDAVSLGKPGYRTDKITLSEDPKKPTKAWLVPDSKAVFVTKQSGKYDVYKSDVDGKNGEVLLAGTGSENSNISLVVNPEGNRAALVSTRSGKRDSGGFLLSSLVLINIDSGSIVTIAESTQIQLIDWIGPRLVFQQASSDSSAGNQYSVISYNYADNTRLQLAAANNLAAVIGARGVIYFAVGADPANPSLQLGLFKIGADGNGKQRIIEDEPVTVLRSTYGALSVQTEDGAWFSYDVSNGSKSQIGSPSSLANRLYMDNASRSRSLWVDQGALINLDIAAGKDTNVATQSGLAYPLRWIGGSSAIYRVSSGNQTADYAVSLEGGKPHKIADVSPTYGFAQAL